MNKPQQLPVVAIFIPVEKKIPSLYERWIAQRENITAH